MHLKRSLHILVYCKPIFESHVVLSKTRKCVVEKIALTDELPSKKQMGQIHFTPNSSNAAYVPC